MRAIKIGVVVLGAMSITALGIDAADTLTGNSSTLLGQLIHSDSSQCPEGMVFVQAGVTFHCADQYEASPATSCVSADPSNSKETLLNMSNTDCSAVSVAGKMPWRFITREQAQLACTRKNARLPSTKEWQLIAAGTPDEREACNIQSNDARLTGRDHNCLSAAGIYDAVGNVWEWTNDDVFDGTLEGRTIPEEGYVQQVDQGGVATETGDEPSELFGADYFWSEAAGVYALLRGGFYSSDEDAGVYTAHAATLPTTAGAAIGFRCVQ